MFGGVRNLLHSPNTTLSLNINSWVEFCLLFFIMYNLTNILKIFSSWTIYTRGSLYSRSMSSRFFRHHSYVLSSPILIRYSWIHFLLAWFSWRQVNSLWRDDHPRSSSPQVLHDSLTSPSAFLSSSSGYTNSTALSLPLNFALQPGWLSSQVLFILDSHHLQLYLPHSWETPLRRSPLNRLPYLQLSGLPWIPVTTILLLFESILNVNQLPASNLGSLSLTELQSSVYSLICASSSMCTTAGTCK